MTRNRNVLFSFVGETPQVVTETLYCLLRDYAILDGQVHLLTTQRMENNAVDLIGEWIKRFNSEYGTKWKPCMDANFAWENDQGGVQVLPIKDINTEDANDKAIDAITRIIYYWTSQDDVDLYVSVAGGRKQLGSYMYQALSWFGQPDRTTLCHVIPSEKLEGGNPDGWIDGYFPEPGTGVSATEKAAEASHGNYVHFVEQPVILLRGLLPYFILDFKNSYLDKENKSVSSFPFSAILEDYLTYDNISNRYRFMQGLVKSSPDIVMVYLDLKNNKFVVKSNRLIKSFVPEKDGKPQNRPAYYFLLYFLYCIKKGCGENQSVSVPYNKNIFIIGNIEDKKENNEEINEDERKGKYLVQCFDRVLSEFLNREIFNDEKYTEICIKIYDEISGLEENKLEENKVAKKIVERLIGYNIYLSEFQEHTLYLGGFVYKNYIDRIKSAINFLKRNPTMIIFNNPIVYLEEELNKVNNEVETNKENHKDLLIKIADNITNIFSELSRQIEKGLGMRSGLKINIFADSSKPSSRYLEVDNPKTLLIELVRN